MKPTPEELAAFADNELDDARHAAVAAAVESDPELAARVRAHRALCEQLSTHFAPIMAEPLPERLVLPLAQTDAVVNLASVRRMREARAPRSLPRWGWLAGPALAASLALALFMPRQDQGGLVEGELAVALDRQLVSEQTSAAPQRILLSFRNQACEYCRAFAAEDRGGIACRGEGGWRLEEAGAGTGPDQREYRMAGNPSAELLERAQAMAAGPALDAAQERTARASGWR